MNHITEFQPIPNTSGQITMSSREIAELVDQRHDNVKRAIETLAKKNKRRDAVIQLPQVEEVRNHLGQLVAEYVFTGEQGKRDSLVVVAQLSPEFTARVIDRWQELESRHQTTLPDFTNPAESARAWADQFEQRQVLQIENQQQAQKIASLENLFKEGMTIPQFCKGLNGVNVMAVNACLESRNWLYNESKTGIRWRVAAYARDRYLTEHQQTISPHGQEPFVQFTPTLLRKGAVRLHELYLSGELPMKKSWDGVFTHDKAVRSAA